MKNKLKDITKTESYQYFEYADDAHYEFLWEDFCKLILVWGGKDSFLNSMKEFFAKEQPYYIFSDFLDKNEIKYKRIVFY